MRHLPNVITLLNLLCGVWAIHALYTGQTQDAIILIATAAVFDFFDGFAARLLKAASPIGKDLDSLADMVSFGVFPGLLLVAQIRTQSMGMGSGFWTEHIHFLGYLIPAASALRLAKFNNDARQSQEFIGLPTPANTLLICALVWIDKLPLQWCFVFDSAFRFSIPLALWIFLALYLPWMLNSEIRLLALKFKNYSWKDNRFRWLFLLTAAPMLVLGWHAFPLIILNYIIWSFIYNGLSSASS